MGKRFEVLSIQHAIGLVWKRDFPVAAALKTAADDLGDPDISLVPDKVNILEGDWITLNASHEAVKAVAPSLLSFVVYTGGERFDVRAGGRVTVLWGHYVARTAQIEPAIVVAAGTLLTVSVNSKLRVAVAGEPVVGIAERPKLAGTTQFPDGLVEYSTFLGAHAP
jgi:hypothetical protein